MNFPLDSVGPFDDSPSLKPFSLSEKTLITLQLRSYMYITSVRVISLTVPSEFLIFTSR